VVSPARPQKAQTHSELSQTFEYMKPTLSPIKDDSHKKTEMTELEKK